MSCSRGGSGHGSVIALAAFHAGEIDAREEHDQVRGADLNAWRVGQRSGKAEATHLQALIPYRKAVLFPEQELDAISGFVSEHEDLARERIAAQRVAHDGGQTVERLSQIRRLGAQPDAHRGGQAQHGMPPSPRTSSSRTRVVRSKPGLT